MLKTIKNVEYNYIYNPFESAADRVILEQVAQLHKETYRLTKIDRCDPEGFIPKALDILGHDVILVHDNLYEDLYIIFRAKRRFYIYRTSYGSCTYCDVWQQSPFENNLFNEANDAVGFDSIYELIKYILGNSEMMCHKDIKDYALGQAKSLIERNYNPQQIKQIVLLYSEVD